MDKQKEKTAIERLRAFVPEDGEMASRTVTTGRMANPFSVGGSVMKPTRTNCHFLRRKNEKNTENSDCM